MAAALVALAAAASCTPNDTPKRTETIVPLTEQDVVFGSTLAQIQGHYVAALELYRTGDTEGAATHTGHPVAELLDAIETDVREKDEEVADHLGPALRAVSSVVGSDGTVDELESAIKVAIEVADDAEAAVVGRRRATARYKGSVIAALLDTVANEYDEAVGDEKIALVAEYQDAFGFTEIARARYGEIKGDVRRAGDEQADEIDEDFRALKKALPGVAAPASPVPAKKVAQHATHIGVELEESVDALVPTTLAPGDVFDNIDGLLTRIVAKYKAGKADEAAELAAQAYLENYEHVEAEIIELAPQVNEELEPLLGTELRAAIKEGVPVTELEEKVDRARELLQDAREALEDHD